MCGHERLCMAGDEAREYETMIRILAAALFSALLVAATSAEAKTKREKAENLVARAAETTNYFTTDSAFEALWETADNAKAMVIIPRQIRGGFMLGASGGNAVMLARNEDGSWSQPTFFTIGSLSFGFQAGGEASEIVLLVMTQRGMEHLLSTTVKLGGDVSLAAGPIGAGAKAQTTDVLAFARSRGLYGGVSLEGAILKSRNDWNRAYYNAEVSPADIIYRQRAYNPQSANLQNAVYALSRRDHAAPALAPALPAAPNPNGGQGGAAPAAEAGEPLYEDDAAWGAPVKSD
jgi:lipid-binding SYLF domain-containing protein